VMISGLKWVSCQSCPAKFCVLAKSERRECIRCEHERKRAERRANESRAWHAEKRGEAVRKGGRPRKYKTHSERRRAERQQNAKRQIEFRERVQSNGKPLRIFTETKELQAQKSPLSHYPLTPHHLARKTAPREFGGGSV
jgi:hypothetical protein